MDQRELRVVAPTNFMERYTCRHGSLEFALEFDRHTEASSPL